MNRAFSNLVIHSSNIDDINSSEYEDEPIVLSKDELNNRLKNIRYSELSKLHCRRNNSFELFIE